MTKSAVSVLEKLAPRLTLAARAAKLLIADRHSYLHTTGWMRSLAERRPVDASGGDLPWMNFSIATLLDERLRPDFDVFEFGCGASTTFFARRVRRVWSVEHDTAWLERVRARTLPNVVLTGCAADVDGDYCRVLHAAGVPFDIVVVDGVDRPNCMLQASRALSSRGVIVLDDADRPDYNVAISALARLGFKSLAVTGLKATGNLVERTAVFYREGNCLGI